MTTIKLTNAELMSLAGKNKILDVDVPGREDKITVMGSNMLDLMSPDELSSGYFMTFSELEGAIAAKIETEALFVVMEARRLLGTYNPICFISKATEGEFDVL